MHTTQPRPRRRLAAVLLAAAFAVAPAAVLPAAPASAAGCQLGPSLGALAARAGVSCPGEADSSDTTTTNGWGPRGSACKYGWDKGQLPDGVLEYISGRTWYTQHTDVKGGSINRSTAFKNGKAVGEINIEVRTDRTFVLGINVYGRNGIAHEFAYFDCATSSDGVMYFPGGLNAAQIMPVVGSGTVPGTVQGKLEARGSMSALPGGRYLLRVDLTNRSTTAAWSDFAVDLTGYRITGFPALQTGMTCAPVEGAEMCSMDGISAGQTVSTVLLLESTGATGPTVGLTVSNPGSMFVTPNLNTAPTNKPVTVTNRYYIERP